jgi:catechol 2,3-dioxygenase
MHLTARTERRRGTQGLCQSLRPCALAVKLKSQIPNLIPHMNYTIPAGTRIGHVHLKVSDLDRALAFYQKLLGMEIMQRYGSQAVFLSAGGYHHHIGLNTWYSKNAGPAPGNTCGLFHTAILYPERKDLAVIFQRLHDAKYPIVGASDHGVSEAIYLDDPDGNGVELYWDRPREQWPLDGEGNIEMFTKPLNLGSLMKELD